MHSDQSRPSTERKLTRVEAVGETRVDHAVVRRQLCGSETLSLILRGRGVALRFGGNAESRVLIVDVGAQRAEKGRALLGAAAGRLIVNVVFRQPGAD